MRTIDYFDRGAEIDPGRDAVVDGEFRISFRDLQALTHRLAAALTARG